MEPVAGSITLQQGYVCGKRHLLFIMGIDTFRAIPLLFFSTTGLRNT